MDGVVQESSLALTLGRFAEPELQANIEEQHLRNLGRIHTRLSAFKVYSLDQEVEESLLGVCMRLKLCTSDPWKFKKTLGFADLERLCLLKRIVDAHVLPNLSITAQQQMARYRQTDVQVYDEDTDSTHAVQFKKEESYVFRGGWEQHFVDRRRLVSLEVVGLYWQTNKQQFVFSVLKWVQRSPNPSRGVNQE
ncbi:hypothetical protein M0R45_005269 [Rubus argutus]|uniref:TF-B3 domain-containing protein n=1 Tax=Rubus argutus TaxID=59490 RepID=A0AAW1YM57_RUBAR